MSKASMAHPDPGEYAPYYGKYVSLVPEGDVLASLKEQLEVMLALLRSIPENRAETGYAPGKWSVKEVVGHLIDTERIFAYRALRIARSDATPLSGFDQNEYVANASFNAYPLGELAGEFEHVRGSTCLLFKHLEADAWLRRGAASDVEVSARALAYIIAGHELHHMEILRTRYL